VSFGYQTLSDDYNNKAGMATSSFGAPVGIITYGNASSDAGNVNKLSPLQLAWNSYLSIASMVPNVTFLLLNAAVGHRFPTMPRLVVSLVMMIACMAFNDVTAAMDTDGWQEAFFYATIAMVVLINVNVALFQGGLSGVAARFPPSYMGAMVQGQGLGGIFASAVNVVVLALGITFEDSAFYCFLITVVFLGVAFAALLFLMRTEFFLVRTKNGNPL